MFRAKMRIFAQMCLVFIFSCALQILILHNGHDWGGDFSQYIAQAIAIVSDSIKEQIANNTFMMSHCDSLFGPYVYPWGFPLLLAPLYAMFGLSFYALKMVGVISFGLFVAGFYYFCASRLKRSACIIATLFFMLNPLLVGFANNILSDIPYLCASFFAILCLERLLATSAGELV